MHDGPSRRADHAPASSVETAVLSRANEAVTSLEARAPRSTKALRIGLLGRGTVGGAFARLVDGQATEIEGRTGVRLLITRIGLRAERLARDDGAREARATDDLLGLVTDAEVDVVVECLGGEQPALQLIRAALQAGKPVVTANKELLARHGAELRGAAGAASTELFFEAAVGGGIPVVRTLAVALRGAAVRRVTGILNGTTNYILTQMRDLDLGYDDALEAATKQGYAERDPSADVDGDDAAAKAALLGSLAFHTELNISDVYREGISGLDRSDIELARRLGFEVKLLAVLEELAPATGRATLPRIAARVHPTLVPLSHVLARVDGASNAIFIEGGGFGELLLLGPGAGGDPTASALLSDVLVAGVNLERGSIAPLEPWRASSVVPIDELCSEFFVSVDVADAPGVLAAVAGVFGHHGVSIRAMEQLGLGLEARLVFITHVALEAALQSTLEELRGLAAVRRIGSVLRILREVAS